MDLVPSSVSSIGRRVALALTLALVLPLGAHAFCGFYVAKADTDLFNQASKVVIARDGDRTILTMSNDYQGEPEEFAMVIPVPTFLEREQIHVGNQGAIDHLDAYTAPAPGGVPRRQPVRAAAPVRDEGDVARGLVGPGGVGAHGRLPGRHHRGRPTRWGSTTS